MRKDRFEIKYVFPLERLDELLGFIKPFMNLDPHVKREGERGFYDVSSIYFDSGDFEYYRSHLEGYPTRRKLRIRRYTNEDKEQYFFEIKNKKIFSLFKHRLKLDDNVISQNIADQDYADFCDSFLSRHQDSRISEMINFDLLTLNIKPVLFVSYKRIPYVAKYEHDVRLTVDYDVETSKAYKCLTFEHEFEPRRILPRHAAILELKSNRTIPRWLVDILVNFRLTRTAFSKYVKGIERVYDL